VSLGYLLMGRFLLAKLFFASRRCNGCGLCARSCAHGGVRMRGTPPRPYWTFDCESCMRCMGYCPRQAVEAGHSLAVLLIWLLTLPVVPAAMALAARHVPAVARALAVRPVAWAVGWAWSMLVLWVVYGLVWRLARWPAFNALLTWTTFTHLYRRYHEPDTRLRQVVGKAFQPDKDYAE
jgi:Pyruvate/2-oxoacid:ferredoxin oxidoreductase delta subunit